MPEMPERGALPGIADTVAELNKFGLVIAHSLYFLIVAVIAVFLVHQFARKFLFPRLANKRYAVIFILALHALVLIAALMLVLGQLGIDTSVIAPVALLIVIMVAVIIFFIVPLLPELPFKRGHMVEVGGVRGTVDSILPVFTHVQTFDGKTVFIPNTTVWTKNIVNYHSTPNRRVELKLNVIADHSLADARAVLTDIMRSDERVLGDPAPAVRINAARAEGIDMVGLCWVKNADFLGARSDLYEKVVNAAQSEAGISLSLDKQHVVLQESYKTPIQFSMN
jgi:small conductance mechanosensitive channel